jgi:hypothetical protein
MLVNVHMEAPSSAVIAEMQAPHSRCQIVRRITEEERGNIIDLRCGARRQRLGRELKGFSLEKVGKCRVMLTIGAVHFPKLYDINNCRGKMQVMDLSSEWTHTLLRMAKIPWSRLEYMSYEKVPADRICYSVEATYDARSTGSTAFLSTSKVFCAK